MTSVYNFPIAAPTSSIIPRSFAPLPPPLPVPRFNPVFTVPLARTIVDESLLEPLPPGPRTFDPNNMEIENKHFKNYVERREKRSREIHRLAAAKDHKMQQRLAELKRIQRLDNEEELKRIQERDSAVNEYYQSKMLERSLKEESQLKAQSELQLSAEQQAQLWKNANLDPIGVNNTQLPRSSHRPESALDNLLQNLYNTQLIGRYTIYMPPPASAFVSDSATGKYPPGFSVVHIETQLRVPLYNQDGGLLVPANQLVNIVTGDSTVHFFGPTADTFEVELDVNSEHTPQVWKDFYHYSEELTNPNCRNPFYGCASFPPLS